MALLDGQSEKWPLPPQVEDSPRAIWHCGINQRGDVGLSIEIDLNLPTAGIFRVLDRIAAWRGYPETSGYQ